MANLFDAGRVTQEQLSSPSELQQAQVDYGNTRANEAAKAADQSLKDLSQVHADNEQFFQQAQSAYVSAASNEKLSQATLDFTKAYNERVSNLYDASGNPNFKSLPKDIQKIGQDILNSHLSGINDKEVAINFGNAFRNFTNNQAVQSYGTARNLNEDYVKGSLLSSQEGLTHMAVMGDPASKQFAQKQWLDQVDQAKLSGAITESEAVQLNSKFSESVGRLTGEQLLESEPNRALELAQDPGKFGVILSTEDQLSLSRAAKQGIQLQIRQQEIATEKKLTDIKDITKAIQSEVQSGAYVDPKSFANARRLAKGTVLEAAVEHLVSQNEAQHEFSLKSPAERQNILDSVDPLSVEAKVLSNVHSILNQKLKEDPTSLAIAQKVVDTPSPLDMKKDLLQQLQSRKTIKNTTDGFYGVKSTGLKKEELNQLTTHFEDLGTSEDKLKFISTITQAYGTEGAKTVLAAVDKEAGQTANSWAANMYMNGNKTGALKTMEGANILKKDNIKLSRESFDASYQDLTRPIANATYAAGTYASVFSAYAALAAQKGLLGDPEVNKSLLKQAYEIVDGRPVSVGAGEISAPYDITDKVAFETRMNNITDADILALGGMYEIVGGEKRPVQNPADVLKNLLFVAVEPGKWAVTESPSFFSRNNAIKKSFVKGDGTPFTVDYRKLK